jgi:1-acyl-sn-glycerol-3-phosphate acyltransferase/nucleoside-diphosphate-sugar epimerase
MIDVMVDKQADMLIIGDNDDFTRTMEQHLNRQYKTKVITGNKDKQTFIENNDLDKIKASSQQQFMFYITQSRVDLYGPDIEVVKSLCQTASEQHINTFVLVSSAAIFAPRCNHSGWVSEAKIPIQGINPYADQWILLEKTVKKHLAKDISLIILRPATILFQDSKEFISQLFAAKIVVTLPGFNPTVQCLHPDDFFQAIDAVVNNPLAGIYHLSPEQGIPLWNALSQAGCYFMPGPSLLRRLLTKSDGLKQPIAEEQLQQIRYPWTIANKKSKSILGFKPDYSSLQAIQHAFQDASSQAFSLSYKKGREKKNMAKNNKFIENNSDDYDHYGLDHQYIKRWTKTIFRFLHDKYWRIEYRGVEHIPQKGGAILVGLHRGFMPFDGAMLLQMSVTKLKRYPRFLVHHSLLKPPFLSNFTAKLGGLLACRENADTVLQQDELLCLFPEGIQGAFSYYKNAYQLSSFGGDEYIKIALRNNVPIIPFVTLGSAEIYPIFAKIHWQWFKHHTQWPCLPITPTFPLLPLPLPSKWHTQFLPAFNFHQQYSPECAKDNALIHSLSNKVQTAMKKEIEEMKNKRRSLFFGSIFK